MKYNKGFAPLILVAIIVGALVIGGGVYYLGKSKGEDKKVENSNWSQYSNKYYSINYPDNLIVTKNNDQDNGRTIISTKDYSIDMTNGVINSGFKIDISLHNFDSLDNLFDCNKSNISVTSNCLLSYSETQLDYQKGEVKSEPITINDYPGVKYEFISNINKNNNIGLVVHKDDKYYVVLIAYRNNKDMELFNKILDSFKFIDSTLK